MTDNTGHQRERVAAARRRDPAAAQATTQVKRYIEGEAIDDMIERAERALYAAKGAGRNRTVTL